MRIVRRLGVGRLPLSKKALLSVGVFPVRDHYYEPLFNPRHLRKPLSDERLLPGIASWRVAEQLQLLQSFHFERELESIPEAFVGDTSFHFKNGAYESGDAEYWYSIIRLKKPTKIIEIGSGQSTKMARLAILANQRENASYHCRHICVEPYEMPWLEKTGVEVLRKKAEDVGVEFFEQLEAFLSFNSTWKILGALNFLHHNHYNLLKEKCPKLTPDREPGSFYMVSM
ncbi:MAG: hypothetical protein LBG47_01175 [Prevotellaceae bacterium]|nr:hypothetical protein [Prevotellaceae bacterium]